MGTGYPRVSAVSTVGRMGKSAHRGIKYSCYNVLDEYLIYSLVEILSSESSTLQCGTFFTSTFLSRFIVSSMIDTNGSIVGKIGGPTHEPIAIWALNVWDDMPCWRWLTWSRPPENARSASTDEAIAHIFRSGCVCHEDIVSPGADRKSSAIRANCGRVLSCCSQ